MKRIIITVAAVFALFAGGLIPPAAADPSDPALRVGPESVLYSSSQLTAKGLHGWADSPFGIIPNPSGGFRFFTSTAFGGANHTTLTTGPITDPAQSVSYTHAALSGFPTTAGYTYNSISHVYQVPSTNTLLGFVHLEREPGVSSFLASVGLAKSTDLGNTWQWVGEIVSQNLVAANVENRGYEVGPGGYQIVNPPDDPSNAYFYLYTYDQTDSTDHPAPANAKGTVVSRAKVADVVSAANMGTVPVFHKYFQGGWDQPGLGGAFTNISSDTVTAPDSISYNTTLGAYILASRDYTTGVGQITLRVSPSPIDFSDATVTFRTTLPSPHSTVYPSIVGTGASPQTTSGSSFYLYYLVFPDGETPWGSGTYMAKRSISVSTLGATQHTASTEFSSTQGENQWAYLLNNSTGYHPLTWDATQTRWHGGASDLAIVANTWMHPSAEASVREYTVQRSGNLQIEGLIRKTTAGGDGVQVRILKNDTNIWPASGWQNIDASDITGISPKVATWVNTGDKIRFVIDQKTNPLHDGTNWDPVLTYANNLGGASDSDFSSTQGTNGWNYGVADATGFHTMTYVPGMSAWQAGSTTAQIGSGWAHPGLSQTTELRYVSDTSGPTLLRLRAEKRNWSGSDGVGIRILVNGVQRWPASGWQTVAASGQGAGGQFSTYLSQGDVVSFQLDKLSAVDFDGSSFNAYILPQ